MDSLKTTTASNPAGQYLAMALALAALTTAGASPALAAVHHHPHHHVARSARSLQMYGGQAFAQVGAGGVPDSVPIDMKRATAVHDCSVAASKFSFSAFQTTQLAVYGSCMTEHGQIP